MRRPIPNSFWIIPGKLIAGEYPIGPDYTHARARLAGFKELGISHFMDLTQAGEMPQYRHLLPMYSTYQHSPIADESVPAAADQVRTLLTDIQSTMAEGRRVYVHCRAGIGRTNLVIGCLLAERSGDGDAALIELNELWVENERSTSWPVVPQTVEQANYIRRWPKIRKNLR